MDRTETGSAAPEPSSEAHNTYTTHRLYVLQALHIEAWHVLQERHDSTARKDVTQHRTRQPAAYVPPTFGLPEGKPFSLLHFAASRYSAIGQEPAAYAPPPFGLPDGKPFGLLRFAASRTAGGVLLLPGDKNLDTTSTLTTEVPTHQQLTDTEHLETTSQQLVRKWPP